MTRFCLVPLLVLSGWSLATAQNNSECETQLPMQISVSQYADALKPSRIVIVTTENRQDRLKEQDIFARSLAKQLNKRGFQTVVNDQKLLESRMPASRGTFDERYLIKLARDHRADAVLFCRIPELSGYQPMRIQASALLVNVAEAVSLVSITGSLDLSATQYQWTYGDTASDEHMLATRLSSPTQLIRYTAEKIASRIGMCWAY